MQAHWLRHVYKNHIEALSALRRRALLLTMVAVERVLREGNESAFCR